MGSCVSLSRDVTPEPYTSLTSKEGSVQRRQELIVEKTQVLPEQQAPEDDGCVIAVADQPSSIVAAAEDAVDVITAIGIVGVSAAIDTAGIIYDAVRFEESISGAMVLEAGAALLEAFEHMPFVGPVTFLLGTVVSASMEAVVLREDARAFAEVTRRVEKVMLKANHIECQREPVEKIIEVLKESLTLVKRLASRVGGSKKCGSCL